MLAIKVLSTIDSLTAELAVISMEN